MFTSPCLALLYVWVRLSFQPFLWFSLLIDQLRPLDLHSLIGLWKSNKNDSMIWKLSTTGILTYDNRNKRVSFGTSTYTKFTLTCTSIKFTHYPVYYSWQYEGRPKVWLTTYMYMQCKVDYYHCWSMKLKATQYDSITEWMGKYNGPQNFSSDSPYKQ